MAHHQALPLSCWMNRTHTHAGTLAHCRRNGKRATAEGTPPSFTGRLRCFGAESGQKGRKKRERPQACRAPPGPPVANERASACGTHAENACSRAARRRRAEDTRQATRLTGHAWLGNVIIIVLSFCQILEPGSEFTELFRKYIYSRNRSVSINLYLLIIAVAHFLRAAFQTTKQSGPRLRPLLPPGLGTGPLCKVAHPPRPDLRGRARLRQPHANWRQTIRQHLPVGDHAKAHQSAVRDSGPVSSNQHTRFSAHRRPAKLCAQRQQPREGRRGNECLSEGQQ